jgi:hypothetical protein
MPKKFYEIDYKGQLGHGLAIVTNIRSRWKFLPAKKGLALA